MNVDIYCPQCGTLFTVRRELLGKRTKCTRCGGAFIIAEPAATSGIIPKVEPPAPPAQPVVFPDLGSAARHGAAPPPFVAPPSPAGGGTHAPPAEHRDTNPRRFPFLRLVARAYEVLAIFAVIIAAFQFIAAVAIIIRNPGSALVVIPPSVVTVFAMAAAAVTLVFAAQMIRLALQVEQNTRETRDACQQLAAHLGGIEHEP
jgi:hypothetical protein